MRKSGTKERQHNKRLLEICGIIGNNVVRLRGGMSEEKFAKKVGLSRATIRSIEEKNPPSLESLIKIADAFNLEPADLFLTGRDRTEISYKSKKLIGKVMTVLEKDLNF